MILVTGASGYVGGRALRALLRQGLPAIGMARHAPVEEPGGSAMRIADYGDPESLSRAFQGISTLLLVSSDGDGRAMLRHHANAIEAAVAGGVASIVFTSIVDIDVGSPFYFAPVYRDAERRLRDSGMAWTILRCGLYSDLILNDWIRPALASGSLSLPVGDGRVAPVPRDDVAQAAAAVAASPGRHAGKIHELTGPLPLSFARMAEMAGKAFGRRLKFVPCPVADYLERSLATTQDPWPHAYSTLCRSIAEGRYEHATDTCEALTGRPAVDFEAFVRQAART